MRVFFYYFLNSIVYLQITFKFVYQNDALVSEIYLYDDEFKFRCSDVFYFRQRCESLSNLACFGLPIV